MSISLELCVLNRSKDIFHIYTRIDTPQLIKHDIVHVYNLCARNRIVQSFILGHLVDLMFSNDFFFFSLNKHMRSQIAVIGFFLILHIRSKKSMHILFTPSPRVLYTSTVRVCVYYGLCV